MNRHCEGIPPKSHFGRQRRPCCDPSSGGRRIPSYDREQRSHEATRIPGAAVCLAQGRLLASNRARCPQRRQSKYAATYENTVGGCRKGGGQAVCRRDSRMAETRAIQGQRYLCERRDDQVEGEEDQVEDRLYMSMYFSMYYIHGRQRSDCEFTKHSHPSLYCRFMSLFPTASVRLCLIHVERRNVRCIVW